MSNPERDPQELHCTGDHEATGELLVLTPREVPLGGPRAMTVRRTLPHRDRPFVGAWCFVDHYGPDDVSETGGMDVAPHPHTGLQTVSWLFEGEIEHRDTAGHHAMVRPGEVNLMTSGGGIAHSEVSTTATSTLHGVQLWVVLPEADRDAPRAFESYAPPLTDVADGVRARVFVGSLAGTLAGSFVGAASPIRTFTSLLGAEVHLDPGARWQVELDPAFEHGVLLDVGELTVDGRRLSFGDLAIRDAGARTLSLEAGATPVRLMLLGGEPYGEEIVMWWNFIGRDHDEVARFREQWQDDSAKAHRFGEVEGYLPRAGGLDWLPAPTLPGGRLRSRGRRRSSS